LETFRASNKGFMSLDGETEQKKEGNIMDRILDIYSSLNATHRIVVGETSSPHVDMASSRGRSPVESLNWCAARSTPHLAAWNPRVVVELRIQELVQKLQNGGDPNEKDDLGRTPLMYVAAGNEIYKDLLAINMPGRERVTKILLDMYADPKEEDNDGNTVLEYFHQFVGAEHPSSALVMEATKKGSATKKANTE